MAENILRDRLQAFCIGFRTHPESYESIAKYEVNNINQYVNAGYIQETTPQHYLALTKESVEEQRKLLKDEGAGRDIIFALCDILVHVNSDQMLLKNILAVLDGMIMDDKSLIRHLIYIQRNPKNPQQLIQTLNRNQMTSNDSFIIETSTHILAILLTEMKIQNQGEVDTELTNFLNWALSSSERQECIITSFIHLFKITFVRLDFIQKRGIQNFMIPFVREKQGQPQPIYEAMFNLWLLSFDDQSLQVFENPQFQIVRIIAKELQLATKEKVIRVIMNCLQLLSRNERCVEQMIESSIDKTLENLSKRIIKDQDISECIIKLQETLHQSMVILTSLEKYLKELNSGQLVPGPIHTEKFWKENAKAFEENQFQHIRKLGDLLNGSDEQTIALACYDLGEFARNHAYAKPILEKIGVKQKVMELMAVGTLDIKEAALICIQKFMISKWGEFQSYS